MYLSEAMVYRCRFDQYVCFLVTEPQCGLPLDLLVVLQDTHSRPRIYFILLVILAYLCPLALCPVTLRCLSPSMLPFYISFLYTVSIRGTVSPPPRKVEVKLSLPHVPKPQLNITL